MFESLFTKTFLILGTQLLITWGVTIMVIRFITRLYHAKNPNIMATTNKDGQLDLHIDWENIKSHVFGLFALWFGIFLLLCYYSFFFKHMNLFICIPLFTIWSILTGITLALALISVDENLGGKVLAITATIIFICALIGIESGIDFGVLEVMLSLGLTILLLSNLVFLFVSIPSVYQRVKAFFGVALFTGYLLFDFNHLEKLNKSTIANTWATAMILSIDIYLDIINLFIKLLRLLSSHHQ